MKLNKQFYEEARKAFIVHTGWTEQEFETAAKEIVQHGPETGYPMLTYYKDLLDFFRQNQRLCLMYVRYASAGCDMTPTEWVKSLSWAIDIADPFYSLLADDDDAGIAAGAIVWAMLQAVCDFYA